MKVSIITVTYNSAATLTMAMDSVLNQSYKNIEYLVIDGGSTDGSQAIIRSYEKRFNGRLRWISEKDNGLYDAMNKGVALSSGDVVGILNSDDFFTSTGVIEKMVENFDDDTDAVYGDVHFVKGSNLGKCIRYYSGRMFRPKLIEYGFIAPHPSFYIRRGIFDKYGMYDARYSISADFELIARLCYKYGIRTKYIHLDFVTMRTGGASTKSIKARKLGTIEDIIACRHLGIKTGKLKILLKYPIKLASAIFIRN